MNHNSQMHSESHVSQSKQTSNRKLNIESFMMNKAKTKHKLLFFAHR